jgi:hypothetical protein
MPRWSNLIRAVVACGQLAAMAAVGQEGHDHMALWSTEDGGGELVADWDFDPIQTSEAFCGGGMCLFTSANPAFLYTGTTPPAGLHTLADDTAISLEIVAQDAAASVRIDGVTVGEGQSARLGTAPDLHNHPSWRLLLPEGDAGDFSLSFRLLSESPAYVDSVVYTAVLSNAMPPPTPTPVPIPCSGDCNGDGRITVSEIVLAVNIVLARTELSACPSADGDGDGGVSISDVVRAVNGSLLGCVAPLAPVFADIQARVFSPRCAESFCHDATTRAGDLSLDEDAAFAELVGVAADNAAARAAGLLRVAAGDPSASFLIVKLGDPSAEFGSRMPLVGTALSSQEIAAISEWIADGAGLD